jgi:hypothetical protein
MDESLIELAAYVRRKTWLPDQDLVRLTIAARAGVIYRITGETGAELLFSATQYALEKLTGTERRYPPVIWTCPHCRRQVTDRAPGGRPAHIEHGHAPDCARLVRDQAADEQRRRDRLPGLILHSEPAVGPVQRHWLRERITDDCPRCGWRGYFHHYMATIDGDWGAAVCDDCYADLHPGITVTVTFYSARWPADGRAVAAIRQRTRSDHNYPDIWWFPDIGQAITWQLWWQHTPMLVDDQRGNCIEDIAEIGREEAEQIAAELAAHNWPTDAAWLPWVVSAYPES